jgi:hypothetical protein
MASHPSDLRRFLALIGVCVSLTCVGCAETKAKAAAPVVISPQPNSERPMNVAPDTDAQPPQPSDGPPPEISTDIKLPPLSSIPIAKMPSAPPKPPSEQPASEPTTEASSHPPAPQISPVLSPAAQQNYERQTNDDVGVAEKNLQQTNGHPLNAGQRDMLEKVRSFIEQSHDASKGGDWARAQNLAQKARLLSVELVNSL